MKIATVSFKDLADKKQNPTLCMSALRGTEQCHLCDKITKEITHTLLKEVLVKLKCKPAFTPENIVILNEYDALLTKREQLQNDIDIVKTRLHLKVDYTDPRVT
jgi:hypothetical protein